MQAKKVLLYIRSRKRIPGDYGTRLGKLVVKNLGSTSNLFALGAAAFQLMVVYRALVAFIKVNRRSHGRYRSYVNTRVHSYCWRNLAIEEKI